MTGVICGNCALPKREILARDTLNLAQDQARHPGTLPTEELRLKKESPSTTHRNMGNSSDRSAKSSSSISSSLSSEPASTQRRDRMSKPQRANPVYSSLQHTTWGANKGRKMKQHGNFQYQGAPNIPLVQVAFAVGESSDLSATACRPLGRKQATA
eukprot:1137770-Pelagomonas_calceolata.AAC.16